MNKPKIKKGAAVTLLSLLLVAVIALGGTLAYLSDNTNKMTNRFSFPKDDEGLSAVLTEPYWDGAIAYEYVSGVMLPIYAYDESGNAIYDRPNSNTNNDMDGTYGVEKAQNMLPGSVAYKNPTVTNTSTVTDEWIALKLTFVYTGNEVTGKPLSDTDMGSLMKVITIDFNTSSSGDGDQKWWVLKTNGVENVGGTVSESDEKMEPYMEYYYTNKVDIGKQTEPLFTSVKIKDSVEKSEYDSNLGKLKETGFAIYIEGFAIQGSAFDNYGKFIDGKNIDGENIVRFNHTPTEENPLTDLDSICLPADENDKENV